MERIPTYALYGEVDRFALRDWLHWESIQSRSRLHGYRIAPHRHEEFIQFLHLAGGNTEARLDGQRLRLFSPAVIVVPPATVHGYVFSEDVGGKVVTLMQRDMRDLELPGPAVLQGDIEAVVDALDRLVAEAGNPGNGHDRAMEAHVSLLAIATRRSRDAQTMPAGDTRAGRARAHLSAFRRLVDEKFRQTRRISDYSTQIGISETHLNRLCRDGLGVSALSVIEERIALEARRMLLFTDLPIKKIGAELGYEDPAYFTRFVTKKLAMAPGAYRRRVQALG